MAEESMVEQLRAYCFAIDCSANQIDNQIANQIANQIDNASRAQTHRKPAAAFFFHSRIERDLARVNHF